VEENKVGLGKLVIEFIVYILY